MTIERDNRADNTTIPALLDEREAARRLGLQETTLRRWRWAGHPPKFLKIGSAVRYDPAEIEAFIKAARRTSTSDPGDGIRP